MAKSAKDLYKLALANNKKNAKNKPIVEKEDIKTFKTKCLAAVDKMVEEGLLVTEVKITEKEIEVIHTVIEDLRKMSYRHCFIEIQDAWGDVLEHRLRISLAHLGK